MALRINSSSLLEKAYLDVVPDGVIFYKSAFTGSKRRFRFDEIRCVLMSPQRVLSFQVGNEVFSLQTKPKHQNIIDALVNGALRANGRA